MTYGVGPHTVPFLANLLVRQRDNAGGKTGRGERERKRDRERGTRGETAGKERDGGGGGGAAHHDTLWFDFQSRTHGIYPIGKDVQHEIRVCLCHALHPLQCCLQPAFQSSVTILTL
jgi:hypothetical protein